MDVLLRTLVGACLALWTAFVIVVTAMIVSARVEPVRLDLGTVTIERPVLQEDDPAWDCRVDGNRVCGGK